MFDIMIGTRVSLDLALQTPVDDGQIALLVPQLS
jgi:hypothetical protein